MSFYDSYDYWTMPRDDGLTADWFVAAYGARGITAAQFRPTRAAVIKEIASRYNVNEVLSTEELMGAEGSWHQKQGELV